MGAIMGERLSTSCRRRPRARPVDAAQNATGVNGTALVAGASLTHGGYSGVMGGLPAECKWSGHPA